MKSRKKINNIEIKYNPLSSSVQSFADCCNEIGTYITNSCSKTWVGSPLRIHRRCDNPMFKIANQISYDNLMIHKALQILQPGDVLVVDGGGDISRALFGEIMMTVAKSRGAVGVVFDAAIRDVEAFEKHRFPCWARGVNMRGPLKDGPGSINVPVSIGGMVIHPGDVILGDCDGIIALSPELALEGARLGKEKEITERKTIQSIIDGKYDDSWVDATLKQKGVI